MKYIKTALFVGNNADTIKKVSDINGYDYTDHPVYKEKHCINLINNCHCSKEWYEKMVIQ